LSLYYNSLLIKPAGDQEFLILCFGSSWPSDVKPRQN